MKTAASPAESDRGAGYQVGSESVFHACNAGILRQDFTQGQWLFLIFE